MNILCVIPSRIGSTRLPRKPLLPLNGKPMIQHVYENAKRCAQLAEVVVATDDEEIAAVIHALGGHAILTDPDLPSGSHRTAAVAKHFDNMDIIINLQGDEPLVQPSMLETLVTPWQTDNTLDMATLASPLREESEYLSPHIVKVITNQKHNALYFSRAPIPYFRIKTEVPVFHHIGVYAFRRDFLDHFITLSDTPLGKAEQLEQLRVLEHGYSIRVCLTQHKTLEINTPEEYAAAQKLLMATA